MDDGTVEVSRPLSPGVVRTVGTYPTDDGPQSYVVDLAFGIYLLMFVDGNDRAMEPGTRTTYAFEMAPPDMPPITSGANLSLAVAAIDLNESPVPFGDTHFVNVGAPHDHTIGDCTFSALEIRYEYESDPGSTEGYIYFPELGISYFAWWEGADGQRDTYRPVRIEAAG